MRRRTAGAIWCCGTPVADRLYRAIDVALLISSGWDPATQVFAPDREHPLLGYPVRRVGCALEAWISVARAVVAGPASSAAAATTFMLFLLAWRGLARTGHGTGVAWSAESLASNGRWSHQSVPELRWGKAPPGSERTLRGRRCRVPSPAAPRPGFGTCTVASCGGSAALAR